jgi:hypothetical protein
MRQPPIFTRDRGRQEIGCIATVRASIRARCAPLGIRKTFDGSEKIPHPEEAAKWPSRRTHCVNPADRRFLYPRDTRNSAAVHRIIGRLWLVS